MAETKKTAMEISQERVEEAEKKLLAEKEILQFLASNPMFARAVIYITQNSRDHVGNYLSW